MPSPEAQIVDCVVCSYAFRALEKIRMHTLARVQALTKPTELHDNIGIC